MIELGIVLQYYIRYRIVWLHDNDSDDIENNA